MNKSEIKIPGYVDLQVNGYKGIDFSSNQLTGKDFIYACKELVKNGTVAFLPTIITSSLEVYERNLKLMNKLMEHNELKRHILGIHLEGPFISKEDGARGAHNQNYIQKPDLRLLDKLYKWSGEKIKLITIAAELEGSETLCKYATSLGITVSLGHQMATDDEISRLADAGARSLTHLGNGLPRLIPRHENPLLSGIANDNLMAMVIPDGHHLPPSLLKIIFRTKGVCNLIVVSDASPIAGLPEGKYNTLGNDVVLEASGRLYNPDTGYLVGSSSTMSEGINYLSSLQIMESENLFDLGFFNPLRLINIEPSSLI